MTASASQPTVRRERRIIERPRLIKLLDETDARTILLLAPAGYGKTTLARQWAKTLNGAVWMTLTPAHRDIAIVATELVRLVNTGSDEAAQFMATYLRAHPNPQRRPREIALIVAQQLRTARTQWVIFDDYHEIAAESVAEEFIAVLNAELTARFLIASRIRPLWATARLAVYGDVGELDRTELALSAEESRRILGRHSNVEQVIAKAGGWPAVVALAAIAPSVPVPGEQVASGLLHDYLAEELFRATPEQFQRQLVRLALAPDLRQETLARTFGTATGGLLAEAYERGFLTSPGEAFELHPLVREFLLQKVAELPNSSTLIRESIEACRERGRWDRAFDLVLRFDRTDLVEPTLEAGYVALLRSGQLATLDRFAATVRATAGSPPAVVDLVAADAALADGAYALASRIASRAANRFPLRHPLISRAHTIRGISEYSLGHLSAAETGYRSAFESATSDEDKLHALREWTLAALQGEKEPPLWVTEALEDHRTASPLDLVRHTTLELTRRHFTSGCCEVRSLIADAQPVVPQVEDPRVRSSFWHVGAYMTALTADYAGALVMQALANADIESFDLDFARPHAYSNGAYFALGLRKFGTAERALQRLEDAIAADPADFHVVNARILRARLALETGKPRDALSALPPLKREVVIPSVGGEYMATRALALALCGHADAACTQVCRADEMTSAVEVRVLSATVRAILRPDHERRRAMVDLWELAEILDTWDPLVASIRSSRELAETLADTTSLRTSLAQLFQRSNDLGLARRFGLRARATRRATDLLSPRESEILGLMARGYRNHEIAKALVLSPSTVKVHVRHIYEKLGVRTRSEAVTRLTLSD